MWHPTDPQLFITGSSDSTIRWARRQSTEHVYNCQFRIWDIENKRKQKTVIVVKSKDRGARTRVTACSYSPDGRVIAGGMSNFVRSTVCLNPELGCLDGALHLWNTSSNFVRPNMTIETAHQKSTETGSIVFSLDGRTMLTRGGDHTVKRKEFVLVSDRLGLQAPVWDMRNFRKPLQEKGELTSLYSGTNAIFSPDERHIVTGCGVSQKGQHGRLVFLDREGLEKVESVELDSTVVKVLWHPRINQVCNSSSSSNMTRLYQILAGTASGKLSTLFSPRTSTNGAKLLANKGPPKRGNYRVAVSVVDGATNHCAACIANVQGRR